MPQKLKLPNGQTIIIPDDMTQDQKNAYTQAAIDNAIGERQEAFAADAPIPLPKLPGIPPVSVKPSTARGVMDVGAELAGGTLGAIAGTPLGPEVAIPAAGGGAVAAKKGSRWLQGKMGLSPEPYGLDEGVSDFLYNAGGEGLGRAPLAAWRRLKGLYRAGADTKIAKQNMDMLFDLGIDNPPLYMILEDANPKFDFRGLHEWASKNWFSAGIMRDSAEKASRQALEHFYRKVRVPNAEGGWYLPDIEDAGSAFRSGAERSMPAWREAGNAMYSEVFRKMPRDMPVEWTNTKTFLESRASLDPVLGSLTSDTLRGTHKNLREAYVQEFKKTLYGLTPAERVKPMPFEQLQALRTQIGHRVTSWEPGSDLPRKDLKDMYRAVTKDMEAAAEKAGVLDEFQKANEFWSENLKVQEELFDKINNKIRSDAEIGEAIQRFAKRGGGQGDSQRLLQIRETFGGSSEEWGVVRNYLLKETGMDSAGNFDIVQFGKRYGRLTDKAKQALIPDATARESFEKFYDAAMKFGHDINIGKRTSFSRMTRAEMLGPVSGAMTLGLLGGGVGWAASGNVPAGGSLAILGALSYVTPRAAAKLMTSQKFTKFATEAMTKKPETIAGMVTRLATNVGTLEPSEQVAFAEFFNIFAQMFPGQRQQQQRAPGVLGGQ